MCRKVAIIKFQPGNLMIELIELIFISCLFVAADHFSECVESHAFETYDKFIKDQGGSVRSVLYCLCKLSCRDNNTSLKLCCLFDL